MDLTNTTLGGRYRLGAVIGTGGMSDVYAATDELLGRDVAVKMMRADLARDETFLERFRREAKNAAKLNHQAIVAVYDTGQTDAASGSVPYIVMERVHGSTLREIVRDSGPLPLAEASRVMSEVCQALSFSHEAGIIHRDVKPANIMITNTGAVKVMDFGIARALSDSTSAMTQTSAVIGTAQYLSPEQARGRSADARSDLYAAGCVLYEISTGQPPFSGESPFSVAFQHVQDAPTPPSTLPGMNLTPQQALALDSVALTAMSKDPSDRYDSAADMANDLQAISEGRMPLAAVNYMDTTAFDAVEDDGGPATTVFAPAVPVASGAGDRAPQSIPAADSALSRDEDGRKSSGRSRAANIAWAVALIALLGVAGVVAYNIFSGGIGSNRSQVTVPSVENMSEADAQELLEDAGFKVEVTEQADADVERGMAIGTDPAADSSVPEGSQITLLVSSGKEITEVPDLTGMTTERASQALSDVGLKLKSEVEEEASDTVREGEIISQNPGQGSQVSKGTEVSITVSTGAEEVRVPTVSGQTLDEARANLEGAGFVVEVNMVDSTRDANLVISASNEGTQQPKGSTVTLSVSRGNQFVMPDLQGKDYNDVSDALRQAGWTGSTIRREEVSTLDALAIDQVVGQSSSAGTAVNKDATITVQVNVLGVP
ncbi:Stk1 family PASTA domain-containing Ser/Thr kinase [Corynebacterium terpenotabidum]|uniref:non-specific serine/threonine protein kinase n=1 Tax=Corynebacterium terpenotabidum Y-11 TaxID=1200352 RepID=S4X9D4_9CORY|nr:Stk1 family PASTA domain-containing Ser/Thr kinase [Corynebacterium terpenotabidum]AGP29717.1 serine/threonine protein kinase [Corynebacterium terpenotabidum Y-11]